jgi:hypothetical protein
MITSYQRSERSRPGRGVRSPTQHLTDAPAASLVYVIGRFAAKFLVQIFASE